MSESRFERIAAGFVVITTECAKFVFGNLAIGLGFQDSVVIFFVLQVLPTIVFFSCLMSVTYYVGLMQKVVRV